MRKVFAAALMLALSTSILLIGGTISLDFCTKNDATGQIKARGLPISLDPQVSTVPLNVVSNDTNPTFKNANGTGVGDQSAAPAQNGLVFTNVSVSPNNVDVSVNQTFSVDIWVDNVTDMAGWHIDLLWNSTVLKCMQARVNTPVEWGGAPFDWFNKTAADVDPEAVYTGWQFGPGIVNDYDASYGELCNNYNATCGLYEKAECQGPNGSDYENSFNGSLAIVTLTFQALSAGSTSLDLSYVVIGNEQCGPITNTVYNGFVEVQD